GAVAHPLAEQRRSGAVGVEAPARLASEGARSDELANPRRDLDAELLADRGGHVEPDEVEQRERTHRVTGAEPYAVVDRRGLEVVALGELDRREEGREEQAVDHEARRVGDPDRRLADVLDPRPTAGTRAPGR